MGGTYNGIPIVIDLSCQFKVHSTKNGSFLSMDFHASSNLGNDVHKMSRFECRIMDGRFSTTILIFFFFYKSQLSNSRVGGESILMLLLTCHAMDQNPNPTYI